MIKMAAVEFVNLFASLFYIGFFLQNWDALKIVSNLSLSTAKFLEFRVQ